MKTALSILLCALALTARAAPVFLTNTVVHLAEASAVTLAWDVAPSHTNLASFGVLVGVASGVYNQRLDISTNQTTYTVTNLPFGSTYYFAVVARTVKGLDSEPSNEVSVDLFRPAPVPALRTVEMNAVLEAAPYPLGPWQPVKAFPRTTLMAATEQKFFRVRMNLIPGPVLLRE